MEQSPSFFFFEVCKKAKSKSSQIAFEKKCMQTVSRSDSTEKWFILCSISTLWIASYFCILCASPLEEEMMTTFNLSNTEFALFSTISFLFAVIGSLVTPKMIRIMNLYNSMLISAACELLGQSVFIIGMLSSNMLIMYLGKIQITSVSTLFYHILSQVEYVLALDTAYKMLPYIQRYPFGLRTVCG